MRWSIDSADAYSVAKVRRAVVETLHRITGGDADLFAVEAVLGELLGSEMERGHIALVLTIDLGIGGPCVNIYTQGRAGITGTQGELRRAILQGTRVPMSFESSPQGTHICLRVLRAHEAAAKRNVQGTGVALH